MLDGKSGKVNEDPTGPLHLDKSDKGLFSDEWDFVIDNYLVGANDPYIIDSIGSLRVTPVPSQAPVAIISPSKKPVLPIVEVQQPKQVESAPSIVKLRPPQSIEEKFISRQKILTAEIPLAGDSIELRFFDNAEIDGDSISLFLNDKLIFTNIRLTGNAYSIKLSVADLSDTNELIMVAENLGTIPPNTSYMVAIVNEKRYEARLESTEGSSAMVKFVKDKD